MNERVMMPRASHWISNDDVRFTPDSPRMGTRFYLDVSDEVLARIGAEGVAHAVQRRCWSQSHWASGRCSSPS